MAYYLVVMAHVMDIMHYFSLNDTVAGYIQGQGRVDSSIGYHFNDVFDVYMV